MQGQIQFNCNRICKKKLPKFSNNNIKKTPDSMHVNRLCKEANKSRWNFYY